MAGWLFVIELRIDDMSKPTITKACPAAVQRKDAAYWESVHKTVLSAQKAADRLAKKRRRIFRVYKWDDEESAALFVTEHRP